MHPFDDTPHFKTPAPWGIGSGPIVLRSIGEALDAAGRRIEEISDRWNAAEERDRLLALLQVLASAETSPLEADLQSAKLGIKGFVLYVHRRTAQRASVRSKLRLVTSATPPTATPH
jgi:hypothetical protein